MNNSRFYQQMDYVMTKIMLHIDWFRNYYYCKLVFKEEFRILDYWRFKLGFNRCRYWPSAKTCIIQNESQIFLGKNAIVARNCNYIQGHGKVFIGDYTRVARCCTIVSSNHDLYDHRKAMFKETCIGDYCWIGSNVCIMPGVVLGPRTIVGAGSVVTKSFPGGYVVIAGNPAKVIKELDKEKVEKYRMEHEYYGFVRAKDFPRFREKYLKKIEFEFDIKKISDNEFYK